MIRKISARGPIAVTACVIAAGCAQNQAFRGMSAAEHDRAAAADPSSASEHLAAAAELRRAEQVACAGVPESDREGGPFAHRDWITGVGVVRERLFPKAPEQVTGVNVYLRAAPGVTQQWVGRVIECHRAHGAVVGEQVAASGCPLSLDGAQVGLSSTFSGFRVSITSKDITVAREVIDRCQGLVN
ncbi:MAG TPA: hypothetical protein VE987_16650 [Polyangiaceae bacterium]|nr:hypothetical protein [Polyangiaceae bacterium]